MLTSIIYFGATISPSGTAIAFTGTSTRMFTAMARNQQMPKYFDKVHPIHGVSRRSLVINTLLATMFLVLFRSWSQLAEVLSLFHVISYLPIPIALWVLRDNIGKNKYPFRLPFGRTIAVCVFTLFTTLFTMGNVHTISNIIIIFACAQAIFISLNVKSIDDLISAVSQCYLLLLYFIGLFVLTSFSPENNHHVSQALFLPIAVIFSMVSFFVLTRTERNDAELVPLPLIFIINLERWRGMTNNYKSCQGD